MRHKSVIDLKTMTIGSEVSFGGDCVDWDAACAAVGGYRVAVA